MSRPPVTWACGVTAVPARRSDLLPRTLRSLAAAGFAEPRLFADGGSEREDWGVPPDRLTVRYPAVGAFGNWILALLELYVREPAAERYALFQDDLLAVRGLREYLGRTTTHRNAYWSLYTFLDNEAVTRDLPLGTWVESAVMTGRDKANPRPDPARRQCGAGALGLVFTREGVQLLLRSAEMTAKPAAASLSRKNVDGAVVEAMNAAGWREHVHQPTLLYHAGRLSTVEPGKEWVSAARSWMGEGWNPCSTLVTGSG